MRGKWLLGLFVAALLVLASACGGAGDGDGDDSSAGEAGQEQSADSAGAEPDLDDVPDVVAEVNGEEIGKDEFSTMYEAQFQQMSQQAQASGGDVDEEQLRTQVVENLISTELLLQEADKRNISVSDAEVEQTLQGLAQQNGLESVEALEAALEEQGMERSEIDDQVRVQIQVDEVIADEAGDIEPTAAEVRAFYDQMAAQQEQAGGQAGQESQALPPLEDVRAQVVERLKSQEQSKVAEVLVKDLRASADVVVNL